MKNTTERFLSKAEQRTLKSLAQYNQYTARGTLLCNLITSFVSNGNFTINSKRFDEIKIILPPDAIKSSFLIHSFKSEDLKWKSFGSFNKIRARFLRNDTFTNSNSFSMLRLTPVERILSYYCKLVLMLFI